MKEQLQIIVAYKLILRDLVDVLEYVPRKERFIKEMFLKEAFFLIEFLYEVNLNREKEKYRNQVLSKLSFMDYYLEYFYTKKEISKKIVSKKSHELEVIRRMVCSWLR